MLPYISIPTYKLFGMLPIQPFGILVGIAIVLGYYLGIRRTRKLGLDPEVSADAQVWIVIGGFICAHLVSIFFYFPERILENPLTIFYFWSGLSSFGGLLGAAITTVYYFRKRGLPVLKYVDIYLMGFVPAWIFGRLGCTIVYDHPGIKTDFILGMSDKTGMVGRFYGLYWDGVVRHNLGMYEMLLAVFLTIVIYSLKNVRPFDGFHTAVVLLIYSPVRYIMDELRVGENKYAGLSPGQWFSIFGVALAIYMFVSGVKRGPTPDHPPDKAGTGKKGKKANKP